MIALIDWILNLFRSEDAARAFVAAPEQAMRDAGLAGVSAAQLSSVAATAVPGMVLGGGDPILGLQRAVANQYGLAPAFTPEYTPAYTPSYDPVWNSSPSFAPSPTFAPETNTELASRNATELASNNSVPLLSPTQGAGANAQNGGFNLGFGDITLGRKTIQTATDGGVVVGADSNGDIVSGDGAVLGNANSVTNGDIRADHGSNISTGQAAVIRDSGTTTTAGADAIATADSGSVIKGADNSLNNGTSIGGGQTTTTVGGTGNTATADGRETTLTSTTTEVTHTTTTTTDNSVTDASTTDSSHHSLFDTSLLSGNETALHSEPSFASGNHLLGLGF